MCKAATNIEKFRTALLHFNHGNAIVQWICRALACDTGKANSYQYELLSSEIFKSLAESKYLCNRWRLDYNHRRPQHTLGNQTPAEFASECDEAVLSRVERAQIKEKA